MNNELLIDREKTFVDNLSSLYEYDEDIKHLLYLLIPAFIIKYGLDKEKIVQKTFLETPIIPSQKEDKYIKAYYSSKVYKEHDTVKTKKFMVIQNYTKNSLIELLDNLVHEFNHAINSNQNEVTIEEDRILVRTGLTYRIYDKSSLKFIKKDNSFILEEIINTKQTEDVINILKGFKSQDRSFDATIYAINNETNNEYESKSYYLESYICKEILKNRTFISTLEKLRLSGNIQDIPTWFDAIAGKGCYEKFINLLKEISDLEKEYTLKSLWKKRLLIKIKDKSKEIMQIINMFNENVNFR